MRITKRALASFHFNLYQQAILLLFHSSNCLHNTMQIVFSFLLKYCSIRFNSQHILSNIVSFNWLYTLNTYTHCFRLLFFDSSKSLREILVVMCKFLISTNMSGKHSHFISSFLFITRAITYNRFRDKYIQLALNNGRHFVSIGTHIPAHKNINYGRKFDFFPLLCL